MAPFPLHPLIETAVPVANICAASGDAADILEDEEFDYEWRRCRVPLALIQCRGGIGFDTAHVLSGADAEEERERFAGIRAWMAARGGAAAALDESPPLIVHDRHGFLMLDGWHRLALAHEDGETEVTVFVGISTTPTCQARVTWGMAADDRPVAPAFGPR